MSSYAFPGEILDGLYEQYATIRIFQCPVCNNATFNKWAETGPYKAYSCNHCGLKFMNPQINQIGLNEYYNNYINKRRLSDSRKMEQRRNQYIHDGKLIKFFISTANTKKILDVGCNGGFFLNELGDDFERFGTELDEVSVDYAKECFPDFGMNIYNGDLQAAMFPSGEFDLIVMRGVIEHLLDPQEHVKEASRILKAGGFYFICATPNGDSFCADLYREKWNLFHPIQHLWHFSPNNFSTICSRYKLKNVWQEFPYIGTPYENVKQDLHQISKYISKEDSSISPAFFGNMMSLVYQKI